MHHTENLKGLHEHLRVMNPDTLSLLTKPKSEFAKFESKKWLSLRNSKLVAIELATVIQPVGWAKAIWEGMNIAVLEVRFGPMLQVPEDEEQP